MKVVVDTNIMFSVLLKHKSKERDFLFLSEEIEFFSCRFAIVELFKNKEKILKYSKLTENEILTTFYKLLKLINFYNEDLISPEILKKAFELCHDVDEKDTVFVALTMELGAYLWTGDKKLQEPLVSKGFNQFLFFDELEWKKVKLFSLKT